MKVMVLRYFRYRNRGLCRTLEAMMQLSPQAACLRPIVEKSLTLIARHCGSVKLKPGP